MHLQQERHAPQRGSSCVTIVSQESGERLERLRRALDRAGIETAIQHADSPLRVGVGYIRSIDPQLAGGGSSFVKVSALGAKPALMVNTPGSVRIVEWSPLVTHALRDCGVPQPRRIWCLDRDDLGRAFETLGAPLTFEGVVTRRRVVASVPGELERAFIGAVGPHARRGAIAEASVSEDAARVTIMVVDGACIPLRTAEKRSLSSLAMMRATLVAGSAVAAVGGCAMAVDVTVDASDDPYVTRVHAAPPIERLTEEAVAALVGAIATRLAAVWPPLRSHRAANGRRAPFSAVGTPR